MNGRDLRRWFSEFNDKYFHGRLPDYHLRTSHRVTRLGESGICNRKRKLISILRSLEDDDAKSCLLHEMAHAATSGYHGKAWRQK
jgi:hypothetical protein